MTAHREYKAYPPPRLSCWLHGRVASYLTILYGDSSNSFGSHHSYRMAKSVFISHRYWWQFETDSANETNVSTMAISHLKIML